VRDLVGPAVGHRRAGVDVLLHEVGVVHGVDAGLTRGQQLAHHGVALDDLGVGSDLLPELVHLRLGLAVLQPVLLTFSYQSSSLTSIVSLPLKRGSARSSSSSAPGQLDHLGVPGGQHDV